MWAYTASATAVMFECQERPFFLLAISRNPLQRVFALSPLLNQLLFVWDIQNRFSLILPIDLSTTGKSSLLESGTFLASSQYSLLEKFPHKNQLYIRMRYENTLHRVTERLHPPECFSARLEWALVMLTADPQPTEKPNQTNKKAPNSTPQQ